jgi:hypothetical protein
MFSLSAADLSIASLLVLAAAALVAAAALGFFRVRGR